MPTWKIHNKWAERIGISEEISTYVNMLIDFPQKCPEFLRFCDNYDKKVSQMTKSRRSVLCSSFAEVVGKHDTGRRRKTATYIQLDFLQQKGNEYMRAWYLHHALDYIEKAPVLTVEEILERLEKRTKSSPELEVVSRFIKDHSEEILQDCR